MLFFLFFLLSPALAHIIHPPLLRRHRDLAPLVRRLESTLPDENGTVILTFRNTTRYDNWKNTQLFPACPSTMQSLYPQPDSPSKGIRSAWVRGQADFCSHLDPSKRWVILPTHATPAAYLPNWSVTLSAVASSTGLLIWIWWRQKEDLNLGILASIGLIWDFSQFVYWIYEAARARASPLQASWVNPIAWITLLNHCVWLKERIDKRAGIDKRGEIVELFRGTIMFWLVATIVAVAIGMCSFSGGFTFARFTSVQLGSQSYTLLDSVSQLIEQVWGDSAAFPGDQCLEMIFNPRSPIYTDPAFLQMRILHAVQFTCALVIWIIWIYRYGKGKRAWTIQSILWCLPIQAFGVVWTAVLASQGTPFKWDEQCGVVVIGMSSRWSYWDGHLQDLGYMLQIIRSVLGL